MVTPEMVCLYESTLVGQQRLRDAGYGSGDIEGKIQGIEKGDDRDGDDTTENSALDIELQLAPWITTHNFVQAVQGKGMLQLFGAGDPTGRGEGFSFIRASMKEMFFRAGESAEAKLGGFHIHNYQTFNLFLFFPIAFRRKYPLLPLINQIFSFPFFPHSLNEKKAAYEEKMAKTYHRFSILEQQQVYKEEVNKYPLILNQFEYRCESDLI